jgi:hypothetical protein
MSRKDWKNLSERQRWRAFDALAAGQPLDEDVVPAFLNLQRSRKRDAVHLVWAGPLFFGPVTALAVGLAASREQRQNFLQVAVQASAITLPSTALIFAAIALWAYSVADQRERQLRDQLGESVEDRSDGPHHSKRGSRPDRRTGGHLPHRVHRSRQRLTRNASTVLAWARYSSSTPASSISASSHHVQARRDGHPGWLHRFLGCGRRPADHAGPPSNPR